ncbi:MAG: hypothetical protein K6T71_00135 [Candidatus Bipolaricaulota bacterium]|nr:hypothetical protein [Candidatus Bipolaricaulota bacterium]
MTLRHLAIFTVKFLALLMACVPLWAVLAPFYAGLLAGLGNSTLTLLGLPPLLSLHDRDILLTIPALHIQVTTVTASFYGVPLLVALVWAVPALSRRMRLSLLGLGAMALFHWLNLLGQVGMLLSNSWLGKLSSEQLFVISALGDMLLPALFCMSLALRHRKIFREARP